MTKTKKLQRIKEIEGHLRSYYTYKSGIKNLQRQLDYIMPSMTASYGLEGDSGTFNISSTTENYAIDRIESRKALNLHENIEEYRIIVNSIDEALESLEEEEKHFIVYRYIHGYTISKTAANMRFSDRQVFKIRNMAFNKLLISLSGILDL